MNLIPVKITTRLNALSMIGPISVLLISFALVIKESPFIIDLSVTSLVGMILCWRFKSIGLLVSSSFLWGVLGYHYFEGIPLALWEIGIGSSIQMTFILTSMASLELIDSFQQACKTASATALHEIEEWKVKITDAIESQRAAESESDILKNKILKLQDFLKLKTEQSEMFERLLEMSRNELTELANRNEKIEQTALEQKNFILSLNASIEELNTCIAFQAEAEKKYQELISRSENELKSAYESVTSKEIQLQKNALLIMDLKWEIEKKQESINELESYKIMAKDSAGKVQELGEQLEELIDRLKNLQTEKDKLQKALDDVLKPGNEIEDQGTHHSKELSRVYGLYNQLRSQFSEKSHNLDETRKQLFHAQEKFLLLEKEVQEKFVYDQDQSFATYEKEQVGLTKRIQELELEVEYLEDLIKSKNF